LVAIHSKQIDGSFPAFGESNDNGSVNGPIEMVIPYVLLWVEKLDLGPISRFPVGAIRLKAIARRTSEAKILKTRPSITRNWNDVLNLERDNGQGFCCFAVGTAAFKRYSNSLP
jgi:hypothetical protein